MVMFGFLDGASVGEGPIPSAYRPSRTGVGVGVGIGLCLALLVACGAARS
jgi:hypothetical protein